MTRVHACALLGALVACSDPGAICGRNGQHITFDGTCTFAPSAITIDGDFSDWTSLLAYPPDCPQCANGEVSVVYATTTTEGEVAIYAQTIGRPLTDGSHSYFLELGPIIGPYYGYGWRVRPTTSETIVDYSVTVNGEPVRAAIGDSGIELAVPVRVLPFTASAKASAELEVNKFGTWENEQDFIANPVHYAPVCWDPSSPLCQP